LALLWWQLPSPARGAKTSTAPVPTPAQTTALQELDGLAHLDNVPVDHSRKQALVFTATDDEARSAMLTELTREALISTALPRLESYRHINQPRPESRTQY
jgi:hypothetical protein